MLSFIKKKPSFRAVSCRRSFIDPGSVGTAVSDWASKTKDAKELSRIGYEPGAHHTAAVGRTLGLANKKISSSFSAIKSWVCVLFLPSWLTFPGAFQADPVAILPNSHWNLKPSFDFLNTPFTLPSDVELKLKGDPYIPRPQLATCLSSILQDDRSTLILGPSNLGKTTAVCMELARPKSSSETASHGKIHNLTFRICPSESLRFVVRGSFRDVSTDEKVWPTVGNLFRLPKEICDEGSLQIYATVTSCYCRWACNQEGDSNVGRTLPKNRGSSTRAHLGRSADAVCVKLFHFLTWWVRELRLSPTKFRANARSLVAFLVNMSHAIVAIMTASDPDTADLIRDGIICLLLCSSFPIMSFLFTSAFCFVEVSGARHRIQVITCPSVPINLIYSALFSIRRLKEGVVTLPFVASDGREDLIAFEQELVRSLPIFFWKLRSIFVSQVACFSFWSPLSLPRDFRVSAETRGAVVHQGRGPSYRCCVGKPVWWHFARGARCGTWYSGGWYPFVSILCNSVIYCSSFCLFELP